MREAIWNMVVRFWHVIPRLTRQRRELEHESAEVGPDGDLERHIHVDSNVQLAGQCVLPRRAGSFVVKAYCVVLILTILEFEAVLDRTKVVLNMFKVSRPMYVIPDGSLSLFHYWHL